MPHTAQHHGAPDTSLLMGIMVIVNKLIHLLPAWLLLKLEETVLKLLSELQTRWAGFSPVAPRRALRVSKAEVRLAETGATGRVSGTLMW